MRAFAKRTSWERLPNQPYADVEFDLTETNPTKTGFEQPEALRWLVQERAAIYAAEPLGTETARAAVAGYYRRRGIEVDSRRVVLTAGTSEAYDRIFRLVANTADQILFPTPSYPLIDVLADLADVEVVEVPFLLEGGTFHLDQAALRARVTARTAAAIFVNPNNPTGAYVERGVQQEILRMLGERGLPFVADEVFFDDQLADNLAPISFVTHAEFPGFVLGGLSKFGLLPHLKLGWVVVTGPEPWAAEALARLEIISDAYLTVAGPVQVALPPLLEDAETFRPRVIERLRSNLGVLVSSVGRAPAVGIRVMVPQGGWQVCVRLPGTCDADAWASTLLSRGVRVQSGTLFNMPTRSTVVLSLLTSPEIFSEGVRRLVDVVDEA